MVLRLKTIEPDFAEKLFRVVSSRAESGNIADKVAIIIKAVRGKGDAALFSYTKEFDHFDVTAETIRVTPEEITNAVALCSPELMRSLKTAAARIKSYSEKQMPPELDYVDELGVRLGHRWSAIDAVGLYVPGGLAAYPSSVLMNAIPAIVAGVRRLAMVVPAPEGKINPAVLAAAHVAGITEMYKIGGAQAIAALAYGTATIPAVDKIVGPGNAYVAEAKRQMFGTVGIDMIAGPSEILVIADNKNNPAWIAADLLSQAEHDEAAQSILITDDAAFADAVAAQVSQYVNTLPRKSIAEKSWNNHGAIIVVESLDEACEVANRIAPEHLELAVADPQKALPWIKNAGAIFLGAHTPEAVGDYVAGPSHVLPTSGTARFSSGLSVFDFLKRTSLIGCDEKSFAALSAQTKTLAESEGLAAHALSIHVRTS